VFALPDVTAERAGRYITATASSGNTEETVNGVFGVLTRPVGSLRSLSTNFNIGAAFAKVAAGARQLPLAGVSSLVICR
jgi:hypothetical protein